MAMKNARIIATPIAPITDLESAINVLSTRTIKQGKERMKMITTKSCNSCKHFPNDHHCVGCVWDEDKGENTKWELKKNPIVIERAVLDKIRAEISEYKDNKIIHAERNEMIDIMLALIDKYRNGVSK